MNYPTEKPILNVQYEGGCDYKPCPSCQIGADSFFSEGERCPYDGAFVIILISTDTVMRTGNVLTGEQQNQEVEVESFICPRCKHIGGNFIFGNLTDVEPIYEKNLRGEA